MKTLRNLSTAAITASLLAFCLPSHAVSISIGPTANSYSFDWSFSTVSPTGSLEGSGTLQLTKISNSILQVTVTLTNTSGLTSNRLTSFGFGIDPNATGVTFSDTSDGGMINASMSSIPSLALIEVCAFGGPNCSGGGNGGILGNGGTDSFTLLLSGSWGSSVNIDPIGFKYQTGSGSYEFTAPGGSVPEPGPLALFGFGLAALVARRRVQAS